MKPIFVIIILVTALVTVNVHSSKAQTPEQLYQKGLVKEEGEGALLDAINLYNQIADNSNADQSLQAKALLHIGMCYEKLGTKEAVKAYQRLVSNFPAQKNEVAAAMERLARLIKIGSTKEIALRQVWAGPQVDMLGSVSADGEYLTFTDWNTGNLAIRNLKTGENKPLTKEGNWKGPVQYALFSLISPDGKKVAYGWYNEKGVWELRLMELGTQTYVSIYFCGTNEYPVPELWFADGKKIIFQESDEKNQKWQLSLIDVTNKEVKVLKEKVPGLSSMVNLSLAPDEKQIAFDFPNPSDKDMYDIYLLSLDSNKEQPLINNPSNDRLLGWMPGRNELLFTSDRSNTTDIWAVNTTGEKPVDVPERILTNVGDITSIIGFTRYGSLYYGIKSDIFESFALSLDQSTGKLSDTPRTAFSGPIFDITWLSDGESLICRKYTEDWIFKLIVYNSKSGESRILADNLDIKGGPKISTDGKSVLSFGIDKLRSEDKTYHGGIYSIDIKTGLPVEIKVKQKINTNGGCVEWDKEGENIYYISDNHIIKHNINTGEEKILFTNKDLFFDPTLKRSFDGKHLLFNGIANTDGPVKLKEGESHLLSIPEDGGEVRILCVASFEGGMYKRINLSPDGKYIYFSAQAPMVKSILCRIPAEGGTPERVWQSKNYQIAGISIHPYGKRIALSTAVSQAEIRVVENLGSKVTEVYSKDK